MARKDTTTAAIADAFARLTSAGRPVTVRALREEARVGTDAARQWLAANRPARDVPDPPAEVLTPVLAPLWSAAIAAARDETAESLAAERDALVAAESSALSDADQQRRRAEQAEATIAQLETDITRLRAELTAALDRAQAADAANAATRTEAAAEIAAERDRARVAEQTAAAAQATATTLRAVVDAFHADRKSM